MKLGVKSFLFLAASLGGFSAITEANQFGTITALQGDVDLFKNPSRTLDGPAPRVSMEGIYYTATKANIGDKIEKGSVLRTNLNAQAKVISEDGDQLYIAPGSSYSIDGETESHASIHLLYGSIRGVVTRFFGKQKNISVKTHDAIMGIRGTDYYISRKGIVPRTKLVVVRGEVSMKRAIASDEKPILVSKGNSGVLTAESLPQIHTTSQLELSVVKKTAHVESTPTTELSQELAERVSGLEKTATEATVEDIKKTDPKIKEIKLAKTEKLEDLNNLVVEEIYSKAPKLHKDITPEEIEEDLSTSGYDKYIDHSGL